MIWGDGGQTAVCSGSWHERARAQQLHVTRDLCSVTLILGSVTLTIRPIKTDRVQCLLIATNPLCAGGCHKTKRDCELEGQTVDRAFRPALAKQSAPSPRASCHASRVLAAPWRPPARPPHAGRLVGPAAVAGSSLRLKLRTGHAMMFIIRTTIVLNGDPSRQAQPWAPRFFDRQAK